MHQPGTLIYNQFRNGTAKRYMLDNINGYYQNSVHLPSDIVAPTTNITDLIHFVYDHIDIPYTIIYRTQSL